MKSFYKTKVIVIFIAIILAFATSVGLTVAWITSQGSTGGDFVIGEVKSELKVNDVSVNESPFNLEINDLVYIDIKKDLFKTDIINILGKEILLEITNTGDEESGEISVRNFVEVIADTGLLYFINVDTAKTSYKDNVSSIITSLSIVDSNTETEIRTAINNDNYNKFKDLYEDNISSVGDTVYVSIVLFGDYNALSDALKSTYKENTYTLTINHSAIQDDYNDSNISYDNEVTK